tara:strand:- start:14114 stop:14554 length:441 start_codon:yes stop_codon:yes gene_type:complete
MAYSGQYKPVNIKKYKGDPRKIFYRSSWELKFMKYCDINAAILEWGSEEIIVPYRCPTDGRVHRYYPDFYIKVRDKQGYLKKYIIEIKPKKQTKPPDVPKRKTKKYLTEVNTFMKNAAKWKAARNFCDDRGMDFLILTEDHLGLSF